MQKQFYCPICQEPREGEVAEVVTSRTRDIAVIRCPNCHEDSTCYFPPNTIPKITVEKNTPTTLNHAPGEGEE